MYRKHDSLVPKPNHECNLCDYTSSIKEVLAMHMHKKHHGATPVLYVFFHLSYVTRSKESHRQEASRHFENFECNKCNFSAKSKVVYKHHEHFKHKKEATLTCELCDYRTSNAQYLKNHIQALCQEDYSWNICRFRFLGLICHGLIIKAHYIKKL